MPLLNMAVALVLVVLVFVGVLLAVRTRKGRAAGGTDTGSTAAFQTQARLFSPVERSFLGVLDQAAGPSVRIFAKVRMADVLSPRKGSARSQWQQQFNRIARKHFDFLLCDADDLSLLAAVELDDASHRDPKRQARDAFVDEACASAGLPLLRFPAQSHYPLDDVRRRLQPVLAKQPAGDEPQATTAGKEAASSPEPARPDAADVSMTCPQCGGALVRRQARRGDRAGLVFFGCSNFPRCRFTATAEPAVIHDEG